MKQFYIILTSDFLQRKDIDPTTKLILGYIATRLNIPEMEWTISKSDIEKQLGLAHATTLRKLKPLINQGILKIKETKLISGGIAQLYRVDRDLFCKIYTKSITDKATSKMDKATSKMDTITKIEKTDKESIDLNTRDKEMTPKQKAINLELFHLACKQLPKDKTSTLYKTMFQSLAKEYGII